MCDVIHNQGFIPWDDDLDIAMLRKDFEKLNEVAPAEFKKPYFWQTEETDKGSAKDGLKRTYMIKKEQLTNVD